MMKNRKILIIVAGPTAVGKTSLSIELALHFKTAIISADSRQFFKELNIGTAKPTEKELKEVEHHLINNLSIKEDYDVALYEEDALHIIEKTIEKNGIAILTGGSGMYIKAVEEGFDEMPAVAPETRAKLNKMLQEEGLGPIKQQLQKLDPEYFSLVDQNNPQRMIRALEVILSSGKPFSSYRTSLKKNRSFQTIKIGLERNRTELYERIDERMEAMIETGLFEEAKSLLPYRQQNALQTVGYKEVFDFLEGKYDRNEAIRLLKRNSRRYAKRQMTWFKKDPEYRWFHPDQKEEIINYIMIDR